MKTTHRKAVGSKGSFLAALVLTAMLIPFQGFAEESGQYSAKLKKSAINVDAINDMLKDRGEVDAWGCEGLFCTCEGNASSPSCKIVAPYCADDIICIGKECSCVYGGGP